MTLFKMVLYISITFSMASCSAAEKSSIIENKVDCSNFSKMEKYNVSLVQLIATPEKFDKKCVHVIGILKSENKETALYLNKNDANSMIMKNAIRIYLEKADFKELEQFSGLHYRVIGFFNAHEIGESLYNGTIDNVHLFEIN